MGILINTLYIYGNILIYKILYIYGNINKYYIYIYKYMGILIYKILYIYIYINMGIYRNIFYIKNIYMGIY